MKQSKKSAKKNLTHWALIHNDNKESLHGHAFEDDEAVIIAINERIEKQDQKFFCEAVKHCSKDGKSVFIFEGIAFKNKRF